MTFKILIGHHLYGLMEKCGISLLTQILGKHTNQGWNNIKGSKGLTGASTLRHDKASNTMEKTKPSVFSTKIKLYKSLVLSIQLYACESWTLIWWDKSKPRAPTKINAIGWCLAYHTKNTKKNERIGLCMTRGQYPEDERFGWLVIALKAEHTLPTCETVDLATAPSSPSQYRLYS